MNSDYLFTQNAASDVLLIFLIDRLGSNDANPIWDGNSPGTYTTLSAKWDREGDREYSTSKSYDSYWIVIYWPTRRADGTVEICKILDFSRG